MDYVLFSIFALQIKIYYALKSGNPLHTSLLRQFFYLLNQLLVLLSPFSLGLETMCRHIIYVYNIE